MALRDDPPSELPGGWVLGSSPAVEPPDELPGGWVRGSSPAVAPDELPGGWVRGSSPAAAQAKPAPTAAAAAPPPQAEPPGALNELMGIVPPPAPPGPMQGPPIPAEPAPVPAPGIPLPPRRPPELMQTPPPIPNEMTDPGLPRTGGTAMDAFIQGLSQGGANAEPMMPGAPAPDGSQTLMQPLKEGREDEAAKIASAEQAWQDAKAEAVRARQEEDAKIAKMGDKGPEGFAKENLLAKRKMGLSDADMADKQADKAFKAFIQARGEGPATQTSTRAAIEGLPRSVADVTVSGLEAVGRPIGELTIGKEKFEKLVEPVKTALARGLAPDPKRADELGQKVVTGLGSTVPFIAAAGVGAALKLSPGISAAIAGALPEAEQLYEEADAAGKSGIDRWKSYVLGLGVGGTEGIPIGNLFHRLEHASGGKLTRAMGILFAQGGEEFLQEGGQRILENAVAKGLIDPNREISDDVADNAIVGGLTGLVFGSAGAAHSALTGHKDVETRIPMPTRIEDQMQTNAPGTFGTELRAGAAAAPDYSKTAPEPKETLPSPAAPDYGKTAPEAAAGTSATAPEQQQAPEATKAAPENKVAVETPAKVLAERGPQGEDHVLKAMGFDDEDIADMSPAERKANLRDAVESGMSLPQAPQAEEGTRAAPTTSPEVAGAKAAEPTPAQAEAGNYQKGHLKIDGLNVTIENGKGSIRSGKGPDGKPWSVEMPAHYGYVKGTEGADGSQMDVFIGDHPSGGKVYVIDQLDEKGRFDEHKAVLGVTTPREAMDLYRKAFSDGKGHKRFGGMKVMETGAFREWLDSGATKAPLTAVETKKPAPRGLGKPVPLVRFLASEGGLKPDQELSYLGLDEHFVPGHGRLIRKGGMTLDEAREKAVEAGYLKDEGYGTAKEATSTPAQLLDAVDKEIRGSKQYSDRDQQQVIDEYERETERGHKDPVKRHHEAFNAVHDYMVEDMPESQIDRPALDRAADLLTAGETSLERAYEDAIMQLYEEGEELGRGDEARGKAEDRGQHEKVRRQNQQPVQEGATAALGERAHQPRAQEEVPPETLKGKPLVEHITEKAKTAKEPAAPTPKPPVVEEKGGDNSEAIRGNPRQVREGGQEPEGGKNQRGEDLQQQAPGEPGVASEQGKGEGGKAPVDLLLADQATWEKTIWDEATRRWDQGKNVVYGTSGKTTIISPKNREALRFRNGKVEFYEGKKGGKERWFPLGPIGQAIDSLAANLGLPTSYARQTAQSKEESKAAPLADHFADYFSDWTMPSFRGILDARKYAKEKTGETDPKKIEEAIETGLIKAARERIDLGYSPQETYDYFARLYTERQPTLGMRTSTSIRDQAYSTPIPLAYLASRLAGIDQNTSVLEPTAGNGALLIEASPKMVLANEINSDRRMALRDQRFRTMAADASSPDFAKDVRQNNPDGRGLAYSRVLANPPFGVVKEGKQSKSFDMGFIQPNYKTNEIDHAISLRALDAMAQNGRAVLILGAPNKLADRSDGYNGKAKREFYLTLYKNYNVVDHFTVDGDLYAKQGAGWPVDVIVIDGKGKSARALPAADVPKLYSSWDALKEKLDGARREDHQPPGPAPIEAKPGPTAAVDERGGVDVGQRGPEPGRPEAPGRPMDVEPRPNRGQPEPARAPEQAPAAEVQPGGVREPGRPDVVAPAEQRQPELKPLKVEQETAGQVSYKPKSKARGLGTLVPVNMRDAVQGALANAQANRGSLDKFVADKLGYKPEELGEYFAAEQLDALALALDNFEKGAGFIIGDQCVAGETRIYDPIAGTHAPIKDLAVAGKPITILSLTVGGLAPTRAGAPFMKGTADLYRFTLDDGRMIIATAGHRFLTPSGWSSLGAGLREGHFLASAEGHAANSLAFDRSIHAVDDRHSTGRPQVSPGRSLACRPDGAQLLLAEGSAPVSSPSQDDARERTHYSSDADGRAPLPKRNHQNQGNAPLSRNNSSPVGSRAPSLIYSQEIASPASELIWKRQNTLPSHGGPALLHQGCGEALLDRHAADEGYSLEREAGTEYQHPEGTSAHGNSSRQSPSKFGVDRRRSHKPSKSHPLPSEKACLCDFPFGDYTGWRRIVSIAFERRDEFYDMIVPSTANYVAEGIVNHNTGIGKGRVNAAVIRYAIKKGFTPIFVTEKPNLYGDMYRDLVDTGIKKMLGREPKIFMTNSGETVPLDEEGKVVLRTSPTTHKATLQKFAAEGKPGDHDIVFTTYNQMQTVKGESTERQRFLSSLAPNSILILDESHNAGGTGPSMIEVKGAPPNRADFVRELVGKAKSVFYSSATYAKRPDVMSLYSKTDMRLAVEDPEMLAEAIAAGGVPMQQVVASALAEAGQYIRRERSFAGVTYDAPLAPVDHKTYNDFSKALAGVQAFSKAIQESTKKLSGELKGEARGASENRSTGGAGASSTNFTSVMHNLVNQMLLAMKAPLAVHGALDAVKAGEKPVITLANTMGSFIAEQAEEQGVKSGQPLDLDFNKLLLRYLEKTRTITVRKPFMEKGEKAEKKYLSDDELGPGGLALYNAAVKAINAANLDALPVSPIDYIKGELAKAGLKVGEITGRNDTLDYSESPPVFRARPGNELSIAGRRKSIADFNSGAMDAIIINQAGATGLSLHASEKVKDQKKRRMIIAQAEGNIDTHMQMLGRVHRTGQVVTPAYTQLVANIPAEKRPAAVLAKKMASLNASTTASRKGALTAEDSPDFMNQYGDIVALRLMNDNPDIHEMLDNPVNLDTQTDGAMRKLTGRIPLLPLKQQEDLYEMIETEYRALIEQMDNLGENALEAKTLDLDARSVDTKTVKEGAGTSPFTAPVQVQIVDAKKQGKPYSSTDALSDAHKGTGAEGGAPALASILKAGVRLRDDKVTSNLAAFTAFSRETLDDMATEETRASTQARLDDVRDRWTGLMTLMPPGARVTLKTADENLSGIVTDVSRGGKAKNPLALGTWRATIAVPGRGPMTFSFSQLNHEKPDEADEKQIQVEPTGWIEKPEQTLANFDALAKDIRERRAIITGNLLAGYDYANRKGQIVHYTDDKGTLNQGILLPRNFKSVADVKGQHAEPLATGEAVLAAANVGRGVIQSSDKTINIFVTNNGAVQFNIEGAKAKGGKYYLNREVLEAAPRDFAKRGSFMAVSVLQPAAPRLIDALMKTGAKFSAPPREKGQPQASIRRGAPSGAVSASVGMSDVGPTPGWMRNPTPEQAKNLDQLMEMTREIAARVAPQTSVYFAPTLLAHGESAKASGATTATAQADALYYANNRIIAMALDVPMKHVANTAHHEAFHDLQTWGLINKEEKALLDREQPRMRQIVQAYYELSHAAMANMIDKEVEAYAYGAYAAARDAGQPPPSIHVGVRRFFERIRDFLRQIAQKVFGMGFRTAEGLFEAARKGDIGKRPQPPDTVDENGNRFWPETSYALRPRRAAVPTIAQPGQLTAPEERTYADFLYQRGFARAGRVSEALGVGRINPTEMRVRFQDRFLRVKRLQEAVEAATGQPITPSQDAYLRESQYYGRAGHRLERMKEDMVDPLVEYMQEHKIGRKELDDYLYAAHAEERNVSIAAINPQMPDAGSGMSTAAAQQHLADVAASGRQPVLENAAQQVYAINKAGLDARLASGLIDQQYYDDLTSRWQRYVPYRGHIEDDGLPHIGKGFDTRGKEFKQALGRGSRAESPLSYSIMQSMEALVRAEKNRVGQAALNMVRANPNPDLWTVDKAKMKRVIDPVTGMVKSAVDPSWLNDPKVMGVKIGGRTHRITFTDPNHARAFKLMGNEDLGGVTRFVGSLTRYIAKMATSLNPDFVLANFIRDVLGALITISDAEKKISRIEFVKGLPSALKGAFQGERGIFTSQWAKEFREFDRLGGKIRFFGREDMEQVKASIDRRLADAEGGAFVWTKEKAQAVMHGVELVNSAVENATRLSAFVAAKKAGMTPEKAANFARELTVNFNRKGEYGPLINAYFVFANANLQGTARMALALKRSPEARAYAGGMVGLGFLMSMFGYLGGGDDDEGKSRYARVPQWEREKNMIIMWPKSVGGYSKIPLPHGFNVFHVIGDRLAGAIFGREKWSDAAGKTITAAMDAFSIIGENANLLSRFTPTIGKWGVELYTNESWTGRPIHPKEVPWTKNKPHSEQPTMATGVFYKGFARKLNELGGGNEHRSAGKWFDQYPGDIQYVANFLTGGLGRFVENSADTMTRMYRGDPWLPEKTPFIRRFYGAENPLMSAKDDYYKQREEQYKAKAEVEGFKKDRNAPAYAEAMDRNKPLMQQAPIFSATEKALKPIHKQRRIIEADTNLSASEKRARSKVLDERELEIVRRANKAVGASAPQ